MLNRQRLLDCFAGLAAIDSPSLGEREMADALTRRLHALGLEVEEDSAGRILGGNAGNLIVRIPGTVEAPVRLFSCHMDTVEPSRGKQVIFHPDGTITSGGDTVLGADDLAGLSAILEAVTVILEDHLPHPPLELVFPVAEELHTLGSHALDFSRLEAKEAYVPDMDGSLGTAALRAPSIISFTAVIHGRAAHAGMAPEAGIHAIKIAAEAVSKISVGHVDEYTTANIGSISGGTTTNIVPAQCTLTGEVRSFRHENALARMAEIRNILEDTAAAWGGRAEVEEVVRMKAYQVEEDAPVVRRLVRACEKLGLTPNLSQTFGGSDNNAFSAHGISGIVIASAMHRIHTCQEYTTEAELYQLAELILELMTDPVSNDT